VKTLHLTAEHLENHAAALAQQLEAGAVLILSGVMGAGKTTFVKGLARGLGATSPVSSPTYTYIHEYETPKGLLVHIDAYRLEDAHKLWKMGLAEYLETAFVVVIEWGEALLEDLPEAQLIRLAVLEAGRELTT
jgi:tRNA threonylcarbamoyladenosine biosynthesis protein TsaE